MSLMSAHARSRAPHQQKLSGKQVATVAALVILITLGLAAYAAAASYESVSHLAAAHGVPLPWLNPAGLDGGLFGVIALDIALTWAGQPLWWLRIVARLFAVGTIAANAAAGWPDPVGVALRIAAPALFVVLVEVARSVLLRRNRTDGVTKIAFARWVLAFRQTWAIWKRQKLWEDSRLPQVAVDAELAITRLAARYGKRWAERAPADLVFMIRAGVRMDEVLARVAELTAPEPVPGPVRGTGLGPVRKRPARTGPGARGNARGVSDTQDLTVELRALQMLDAHPELRAPRMGSELARRLGVTDSYGRKLHRRLTAEDRPAEPVQDRLRERSQERS